MEEGLFWLCMRHRDLDETSALLFIVEFTGAFQLNVRIFDTLRFIRVDAERSHGADVTVDTVQVPHT